MSTARRPKTIQELAQLATTQTYDPSRDLKDQLRAAEHLRKQGMEAEQLGDLETAFVNLARAVTIILGKIPRHPQYHKLTHSQRDTLAGNGHDLLEKLDRLKPRINDAHEHWVLSGGEAAAARAEAEAAEREEEERRREQEERQRQDRRRQAEEERARLHDEGMFRRRDADERERAYRRKQVEKQREMRASDAAKIATQSIQTSQLTPEGKITIDTGGPVNTSGAFCDLFTGTHPIAGKVALKRLRGTNYTDAMMKKIEIEAGLWIKLNHPRILKFLCLYTVDEVTYLVSPFAEFGSLPSYLASSPGADRGCLVTEIAEGLTYLHQFEPAIVHGDVKGNNVLIGSDHHVRICDFGLARHVDTHTATDLKGAGSTPWQAPETLKGVSKSLQSDVYAFGITIYEILSGKIPYSDHPSTGSIVAGVLFYGLRPPLEPSSAPDGTLYSRFWSEATRCWSDSPAERPSMADVLQGLKLSTSPNPPKSSNPASKPTPNHLGAVPELHTAVSITAETSSEPGSMSPDDQQKHHETESEDTDDSRANNLPRPSGWISRVPDEPPSFQRPAPSGASPTSPKPITYPAVHPAQISYVTPPKRDDLNFSYPGPLPLENPNHHQYRDPMDSNDHVYQNGSSQIPRYPSPVATSSQRPIEYSQLMTPHQKQQGYRPSASGMFMDPALMFAESPPGSPGPTFPTGPLGYPQLPNAPYPYQTRPRISSQSSGRQSAAPRRFSLKGERRDSPEPIPPEVPSPSKSGLRTVDLPGETLTKFMQIAAVNTERKVETCGLLLGRKTRNTYTVQSLLIPRQTSDENSCTMTHEELAFEWQENRELLTLGWIHTHPTQSCFMSSLDLHTQSVFQAILPEAFAIVCAPKSSPSFGIFRLTDPPGLQIIMSCDDKRAFHPHPDKPIYTDADSGHVRVMPDLPLEIVDLRNEF